MLKCWPRGTGRGTLGGTLPSLPAVRRIVACRRLPRELSALECLPPVMRDTRLLEDAKLLWHYLWNRAGATIRPDRRLAICEPIAFEQPQFELAFT